MIIQRKPKQSQLDFLWETFEELQGLELKNGKLVGFNKSNEELFSIDFSGLSGGSDSNSVVDFGRRNNLYYIRLADGTEFTSPIESEDLTELKLEVASNTEALLILNGESDGSLKQVLLLAKDYTDSKLLNLDVSQLKLQVDGISDELLILKGSEETEGSVLNIVKNSIDSAFKWKEIIN